MKKLIALSALSFVWTQSALINTNDLYGTNNQVLYGQNNKLSGKDNQALGYGNSIAGQSNAAIGLNNQLYGQQNLVAGTDNKVAGRGNLVSGQGNIIVGSNSSPQQQRAAQQKLMSMLSSRGLGGYLPVQAISNGNGFTSSNSNSQPQPIYQASTTYYSSTPALAEPSPIQQGNSSTVRQNQYVIKQTNSIDNKTNAKQASSLEDQPILTTEKVNQNQSTKNQLSFTNTDLENSASKNNRKEEVVTIQSTKHHFDYSLNDAAQDMGLDDLSGESSSITSTFQTKLPNPQNKPVANQSQIKTYSMNNPVKNQVKTQVKTQVKSEIKTQQKIQPQVSVNESSTKAASSTPEVIKSQPQVKSDVYQYKFYYQQDSPKVDQSLPSESQKVNNHSILNSNENSRYYKASDDLGTVSSSSNSVLIPSNSDSSSKINSEIVPVKSNLRQQPESTVKTDNSYLVKPSSSDPIVVSKAVDAKEQKSLQNTYAQQVIPSKNQTRNSNSTTNQVNAPIQSSTTKPSVRSSSVNSSTSNVIVVSSSSNTQSQVNTNAVNSSKNVVVQKRYRRAANSDDDNAPTGSVIISNVQPAKSSVTSSSSPIVTGSSTTNQYSGMKTANDYAAVYKSSSDVIILSGDSTIKSSSPSQTKKVPTQYFVGNVNYY